MKILSYSHTYMGSGHNAGAETTLHDMMLSLKRHGHSVMALASRPFKDGSGSYVLDGVKVQAFASKLDPQLYFPQFDLVLTQFECAQRAWYIGQDLGIPTVQAVHNNTEYATNLALRYNDSLIYNAWHVKYSIDRLFPKDGVKPSVLFHPMINPTLYRVDSSREYITLINLSDGEPPFYNKGYDIFYHLAEKFPHQQFLGVKGAYGNQVVRDMDNVTIVDHTNNILDIYRRTKILLMPSEIESYGRVAIEAACSGIPSLTSTAPGLIESDIGYKKLPLDQKMAWEQDLNDLLKSTNYDFASYSARQKAQSLYMNSLEEEKDFIRFMEEVV